MLNRAITSAALMAAAVSASGVGSAIVVNGCEYPVHVADTPAAGGGYSEIDKVLQPGEQFSQQYTELTNQQGWSIKLSKTAELTSILQYEYTFHNDGIIWYDLSEVNGNPWDGDWEITASGAGCTPKQQAYRYATDDAYGMQACGSAATITVTLCSGESQNDGSASSAAASAATETSAATPTTMTTAYVTATAAAEKRNAHEHHHRHAHNRRA